MRSRIRIYTRVFSGWFHIKFSCCWYKKSHCGDKTILRSFYVHNNVSINKAISLYWIRAEQPLEQTPSHNLNQWWPSLLTYVCATLPWCIVGSEFWFNTLRPRQNGRHFPADIFKRIFFNENVSISIKISLKFVPKGAINNIPVLFQIMTWRRPGDKPLSEPVIVRLPTHTCVTRPEWVNL